MSIESISSATNQTPVQGQQSAVQQPTAPNNPAVNSTKASDVLRQQQAEQSAEKSKPKQEVKQVELEQAVKNLNQFFQAVSRELQFAVDDKTGRTLITVRDSDTNQTIRQIPSDEVLALARNIADNGEGSLIQEEA